MKVTITIDTDNDAFVYNPGPVSEVSRILTQVAEYLNDGVETPLWSPLTDINGNRVGDLKVTP